MDQKNLFHLVSSTDPVTYTQSVMKYNFKRPEQSISLADCMHQWHEIQSVTTVSSTVFNSANNFVDFNLPKHLHMLDKLYAQITLANASADTDYVFASLISDLIARMEVRAGSKILETITALNTLLDQVVYRDSWEIEKFTPSNDVSKSTFAPASTYNTVAFGTSRTYRIPLRCFLNALGIPLVLLKNQIVLRFYSQYIDNLKTSGTTSDMTCTEFKLYTRELKCSDSKIAKLGMKHLDYRYVMPTLEQASIALTSGSTAKYITNNFDQNDLASHVFVIIQNTTQTGANLDQFLDNVSSIWLEDQSGQSMSNGIQWTNTQLLYDIYPSKFPNLLSQASNKAIYAVAVPSQDPVSDYKTGTCNGALALAKNMKLAITANTSATRLVSIIAMVYKHIRVQNNEVNIY